jgi:hypothetical protein
MKKTHALFVVFAVVYFLGGFPINEEGEEGATAFTPGSGIQTFFINAFIVFVGVKLLS